MNYRDEQQRREAEETARADARALDIIRRADAQKRADAANARGELVERVEFDHSGRKIITFVGPKSAWMDAFKAPGVRVIRFNKNPQGPFYGYAQGGTTHVTEGGK
jgi:hypothetical protein